MCVRTKTTARKAAGATAHGLKPKNNSKNKPSATTRSRQTRANGRGKASAGGHESSDDDDDEKERKKREKSGGIRRSKRKPRAKKPKAKKSKPAAVDEKEEEKKEEEPKAKKDKRPKYQVEEPIHFVSDCFCVFDFFFLSVKREKHGRYRVGKSEVKRHFFILFFFSDFLYFFSRAVERSHESKI